MVADGLKAALADLIPAIFELPTGEKVKITIDEAAFGKPSVPMEAVGVKNQKVLPTECRQRAATYKGDFKVRITFTVDGKSMTVDRSLGNLPIMIKVRDLQYSSCWFKDFIFSQYQNLIIACEIWRKIIIFAFIGLVTRSTTYFQNT